MASDFTGDHPRVRFGITGVAIRIQQFAHLPQAEPEETGNRDPIAAALEDRPAVSRRWIAVQAKPLCLEPRFMRRKADRAAFTLAIPTRERQLVRRYRFQECRQFDQPFPSAGDVAPNFCSCLLFHGAFCSDVIG